jgi:serine/threonine-protein kinase RsbW
MGFVSDGARTEGFVRRKIRDIELAVEEAWVNICTHASLGQEADVAVLGKVEGDDFIIEIIDTGSPFDITSVPDPDITADVDKREIGGLGIFLMKKMADELTYRRDDDRNIIQLIFKKSVT